LTPVFWDGGARGVLLYQCCAGCTAAIFDPADRCRRCLGNNLAWAESAGDGSIATWSTVWRPVIPSYDVPYVVAIVGVDEGYQIVTNIVGGDHTEVRSGLRVEVTFHTDDDRFALPYFRLRSPT
jgi:uncharacterized OB-fold protein